LVYNAFFHPLKHIPGPLLARSCGIPYALRVRNGSIAAWTKELHDKYGDAVRLAPNDVSFISGETAWPDIYGFRTGKHKNTGAYLKDRTWFIKPLNNVWNLLATDEADHSRVRRNLSHAFSEKALREQEPIIQRYADLLVHRMGEHAAEDKPVDIVRWYNYTTFDIICDLTFGEPLYCLRDSEEHKWIRFVFNAAKGLSLLSIPIKYPIFAYYDTLKNYFKDTTTMTRARIEFFTLVREKVTNRLEKGANRPDFFGNVIKNQDVEGKGLTRAEMDVNSVLFLTETTATTLSGTTYLLLSNPAKYTALVAEIRSTFASASDITIEEVNKLDYMIACLQEGLRYYPPVPTGFPRVVPAGGDYISGRYVLGGTAVYVSQFASNHSVRNFKDPEDYVPERWTGDEGYEGDNRESMNAFSFGPRNCLGKRYVFFFPSSSLISCLFV
jgi:cytochrome P450